MSEPAFIEHNGNGKIIRAKSPLRISFAGGGTDLAHWYQSNPGAVINSTINRYAYVTLYPREDHEIRIRSVDLGYSIKYDLEEGPIYNGVLDLAKAVIQRLNVKKGMSLDIRSDTPPGGGLGGSSSVTSAVIGAVAAYTRQVLGNYELAELNFNVERVDLGISGGKQDQYATTFGGFNMIEFFEDRVVVNPLRIERDLINDLEAHLLLCYTGGVRTDVGMIKKQVSYFRDKRSDTIQGMQRLYEMVFEVKEALLRGDLNCFGEMLNEAYLNKKMMNPHVAEGTIADTLYETARKHGVTGGKLLGAGGGGYLLLYCETDKQHIVRKELEKLGGKFMAFNFDKLGLQVWRSTAN
jgi:D-glycero-alpha-D-manno-heptose-7-phosphate kinase